MKDDLPNIFDQKGLDEVAPRRMSVYSYTDDLGPSSMAEIPMIRQDVAPVMMPPAGVIRVPLPPNQSSLTREMIDQLQAEILRRGLAEFEGEDEP